ncbi:MAG: HNH endonuclease signature motif containing protein [Chloroflexota bacterium]|nr:HNH endonuclease signature motif containing protein [Chloroflexota bacterium]
MISAELRRMLVQRAENRCEYCRILDENSYQPHEVDHVYAEKHGGESNEGNLCLACWLCNRHKGSDLTSLDPATGEIVRLFHPRRDVWAEHFRLNDALIEAITDVGRVTVKLLQLNRPNRVAERRIMLALGIYP